MRRLEFTAAFPFCGLGAGARGFLDAQVTLLGRQVRAGDGQDRPVVVATLDLAPEFAINDRSDDLD